MGRGSEGNATFVKLPVRRLCLQIINTISRATRWAVFEPADSSLADRLRGQVLTYLDCLNDLGAFANDNFIVQCDAGVSKRRDHEERGITILLMFHPVDCDEPISLTLHQTASGFRVGSTAFGLSFRQTRA
jgi:phage tail sheath protein FI